MASRNPITARQAFWGRFAGAGQLPNASGATIQSASVQQGDLAYNVSDNQLYVCRTPTSGSADWEAVQYANGGTQGGVIFTGVIGATFGPIAIAPAFTQLPWTQSPPNSGLAFFNHVSPSGSIQIVNEGRYLITTSFGLGIVAGASRSQSQAELRINGVTIPGGIRQMYHRQVAAGETVATFSRVVDIVGGDTVTVEVQRISGAATLQILQDHGEIQIRQIG